jgi:simple sugar transport system permease protein
MKNNKLSFGSAVALQFRRHPEFGALAALIIVFTIFSFTATLFLTIESLGGILTVASELGIIAAGITFLMITGEYDLSIGSTFGLSAMILALAANAGIPLFIGLLLAISAAFFIGLVNGIITTKFNIPSFITTLGAMMFWRGMILAITSGFGVRYWGTSSFLFVLNGKLFGGFRMSSLWLFVVIFSLNLILIKTAYGNATYATGGNKEAARVLGISVNRVKITNFIISATLAGLAGCIQFARFKSVDPLRGTGLELEVIAAVVVGGTLMSGGYGNLIGTLFGVLLMGMVRSGLIMSGAPAYWYQAFIGIILIFAVITSSKLKGWSIR